MSGLKGSLCTISYVNGEAEEIWTIGKTVNWDPANPSRRQLWRKADPNKDLVWMVKDLDAVIVYLLPALVKVESVWDEPSDPGQNLIQGVVPINYHTGEPESRTCEDYNFSSPGFDYLRVFYNETGWERLFPSPARQGSRKIPDNISQCVGWQNVTAPWKLYNRMKYDWMMQSGVISSGRLFGEPQPYAPVPFNGSYIGGSLQSFCAVGLFVHARTCQRLFLLTCHLWWAGNDCKFTLQAPLGFATVLTLQYVVLGENDTLTIVEGEEFPSDEKYKLPNSPEFDQSNLMYNFTGPLGGGEDKSARNTTFMTKRFAYPLSIRLTTTKTGSAPGFLLFYEFLPRSEFLRQQADATQLQYALSLLEMQGANLGSFNWDTLTGQAVGDYPPGVAVLGQMTDAEHCFACCSDLYLHDSCLSQDGTRNESCVSDDETQAQQRLLDGGPIPPVWTIKPYEQSLGATSYLAKGVKSAVSVEDIPELVAYMGYKPEHFIRTNFISYLPPGSIKAPYGKPLGKRYDYEAEGIADPSTDPEPKVRDEIGWGMMSVLVEKGGNFTDRTRHGWGDGWGVGTEAGKGTHWRDGDGASDSWFPSWQLLVKTDLLDARDNPRFDFDLDHPDLPMFSFVDRDRRIIMTNEMALALPCGTMVNNTCGVSCHIVGTGLNRLQCLTNQAKTRCNEPVVDECNNDCGVLGEHRCESSLMALGAVRIRSLKEHDITASFQMTVGAPPRERRDNWTRSEHITGLGVDGVEFGANVSQTPWGHSSTSQSSPDTVDNALYFSFDDPAAEHTDVEFDIFGVKETLTLSREEFRTMVSGPVPIDVPIDCNVQDKGRDACKLASPQDSVAKTNPWYSVASIPSWDTDKDKRMGLLELASVVRQNIVFFSIARRDLRDCRQATGTQCNVVQRTRTEAGKMILEYGRRQSDGMPCAYTDVSQCYMAIDDVLRFLGEYEAFRRNFKERLFSLQRFQLAKVERMGSQGGFELGSPDPTLEHVYNHNTNTLRVSTYFETTGEYARLGSSRYMNRSVTNIMQNVPCLFNVSGSGYYPYGDGVATLESGWTREVVYDTTTCQAQAESLCYVCNDQVCGMCYIAFTEWSIELDSKTMSHVFVDGVVDKEDPIVFQPSEISHSTTLKIETKRAAAFGRPFIELPTVDPANPQTAQSERVLNLPDASGTVVTSGNLHALKRLPGLRKRSSFTPSRYNSANVLHLDDTKQILGGAYHYKTLQGDHTSFCGLFEDGASIPCDPLKVLYDALEDSASRVDDVIRFVGDKILQGPALTNRVPHLSSGSRLDCGRYRESCDVDKPIDRHQSLRFVPRRIKVCYKSGGEAPCRCDKSCAGCYAKQYMTEKEVSVFGGPGLGWNDFESFKSLQANQEENNFRPEYEDWVFPFDSTTSTSEACSAGSGGSSNFTFLHIYYGTDIGVRAWQEMGEYLNETRSARAFPDSMPVQYSALKYLYLQGVAEIQWHEPGALNEEGQVDNIGRLNVERIFGDENELGTFSPSTDYSLPSLPNTLLPVYSGQTMTQLGFPATDTERCIACCEFFASIRNTTNLIEESSCLYVNVSGFDEAEAIGGVYEQLTHRSFGSRAWKQTPGVYYLHMLPLACTSRPGCGTSIRDLPDSVGPAWVIGTELGSDSIVAFAKLDFVLNGTNLPAYQHDLARRQAARDPSSSYLKWYEYNRFGNPKLYRGFWSEVQGRSLESRVGLQVGCFERPVWKFAHTSLTFEDGNEYTKLSFPDADGHLVSTGSLDMITSLGTQVSPILGRHTSLSPHDNNSATTRMNFGIGWQTVNITGENDNVDLDITTRSISYCPIPNEICKYVTDDSDPETSGQFACQGRSLPLRSTLLHHCAFDGGRVPYTDFGVDALVISYADASDCVALFEIDSNFDETGSFEMLNGVQCAPGNTVILAKDDPEGEESIDCLQVTSWELGEVSTWKYPYDRCKTLPSSPTNPMVLHPDDAKTLNEAICPTYDPKTKELDEECRELLRAICQQACLREPDCVAAQPFLGDGEENGNEPNVRCHLIFESCQQIELSESAPFETWVKKSGGWGPSRLARTYPLNLPIGARIALGDIPDQAWTVRERRQQQVTITDALTSSRHYRICPSGLVTSGLFSPPRSESPRAPADCVLARTEGEASLLPAETTCKCPTESLWVQNNVAPGDASVITSKSGTSCCEACASSHGLPAFRGWRWTSDDLYCEWKSWYSRIEENLAARVGDVRGSGQIEGLLCECSARASIPDKKFCNSALDRTFSTSTAVHSGELIHALNLTSAIFPLQIVVRNASSLTSSTMVRIGHDLFHAVVNDFISTIVIHPMHLWGVEKVHAPGTIVTRVIAGGFLNSTLSPFGRVHLPHGVYSLENVTSTLNAKLESMLAERQFTVSFKIVEPDTGLCGEKVHGATRDLRSFHCAPASRYIELSGGIKPNASIRDDDAVHVLSSSKILETLGIHTPIRAYTFGHASMRQLPEGVVHQPVLPGAGYVSSGYGTQSGYGFGGQTGWTNFEPPSSFVGQVVHFTWCHDEWSPGYQCPPSGCKCSSPVATYARVLGTTKTRKGETLKSNTIHVPSSADGIVLSSGNLEDVHVESSHVSGLRINALLEHEKALAMKINGRLEFARCNTVFGSLPDCSPIHTDASSRLDDGSLDRRDISIALDSTSSISFHLWERQVMMVALNNVSDDLYNAAIYSDTNTVWKLLQNEMHSANKTFLSLQDANSLAQLEPVCNKYCQALTAFEEEEFTDAISIAATTLSGVSSLVERTLVDRVKLCAAVACYTDITTPQGPKIKGDNFTVAQYGSEALKKCSSTCKGTGEGCLCSKFVDSGAVCNMPHIKADHDFDNDDDDNDLSPDEVHLWKETLVGSGRRDALDKAVEGYQECGEHLSLTYQAQCAEEESADCSPDNNGNYAVCCSVVLAIRGADSPPVSSGDIADEPGVLALLSVLATDYRHATQQGSEAEARCVCVEIEGSSTKDKGGLMDVQRHICHEVHGISEALLKLIEPFEIPLGVCIADADAHMQLGYNGSESKTVFQFEPTPNGRNDYLTIPYTNGVVLTSGNLDAVTKEAGSMTSLHVAGVTEITDIAHVGVVGVPAESQGSRMGQGHTARTTPDTIPNVAEDAKAHCQGTDVSGTDGFCVKPLHDMVLMNNSMSLASAAEMSNLSFAHATGEWSIAFPAWDSDLCAGHLSSHCESRDPDTHLATFSGRIITTGNLQDLVELSPHYFDTGGHVDVDGPIELGSGYSCELPGKEKSSILSKAHVPRYPYAVWSTFVASQCIEMQEHIDWSDAMHFELSKCKELCEADDSCGAVVVKKGFDRSPETANARCILLRTPATDCTVKSRPGQDLHLLIREAPSPWFAHQAIDTFFESICSNFRSNLTHVPGTAIRFRNFLGGDIVYRESRPYSWTEYPNFKCDTFEGFASDTSTSISKEALFWAAKNFGTQVLLSQITTSLTTDDGWSTFAADSFRKSVKEVVQAAGDVTVDQVLFEAAFRAYYTEHESKTWFTELSVDLSNLNLDIATTVLSGFLASECRALCEQHTDCFTITVSSHNRTCTLAGANGPRRVLATWETLFGPCKRLPSSDTHLFVFKEDQQTVLKFNAPTDSRELTFADASGVILTTGNLYDVHNSVGLFGRDVMTSRTATREDGMYMYDLRVAGNPNPLTSRFSGRTPQMIVRACELQTRCIVYSSTAIDDHVIDELIQTHVQKVGQGNESIPKLDLSFGPRGVRGTGSGFDYFETTIDVAKPGSRTVGECVGECKGTFPCQRAKFTCHEGCPGFMWPRSGVDISEECGPNLRGSVCGCANGNPYGKYGTSVCVMVNSTHPDHGKFCANTTQAGAEVKLLECCEDPDDTKNCGKCVAYAPVIPTGLSQKLTFPHANGTIITTGNVDDLKLDVVKLEALSLIGYMNFGNQFPQEQNSTPTSGYPTGYRYKEEFDTWASHAEFDPVSTRIVGGLRFVAGYGHPNLTYYDDRQGFDSSLEARFGAALADPHTLFHIEAPTLFSDDEALSSLPQFQQRYCIDSEPYHYEADRNDFYQPIERTDPKRCRWKREILMPDCSGTLLTTGNLLETPSVAIPKENLMLSGAESKLKIWGNVTWGRRVNYTHDPFNHHFNHDLEEIPFFAKQFQSSASLFSRIDGDVGLTFQTPGHRIPQITFAPTDGKPDHPFKIDDYGSFFGPSPFGGESPTEEITRFTRDGRNGDARTALWSQDNIRLTIPLGGGVDKALRHFLRGGAPSLPISVQDQVPSMSDPDALYGHFGYQFGRPVLQMRSQTSPSDVDTYNKVSATMSPALLGSYPINESWCYQSFQKLELQDASLSHNKDTTFSTFVRHLMSAGFVKQTQLYGRVFGSPAFNTENLIGNRIDLPACKRFALDSMKKLTGSYQLIYKPLPPVMRQVSSFDEDGNSVVRNMEFGRLNIDFFQNRSSIDHGPDPHCGPIRYNSSVQEIQILEFGKGCVEHGGRMDGEACMDRAGCRNDVERIEECFEFCLKMKSGICTGIVFFTSPRHLELDKAGSCRFVTSLDSKKCTLTHEEMMLKEPSLPFHNYTGYSVTILSQRLQLASRDCRPGMDYDYTSSEFDSFRSQYVLSDSGLRLTGDSAITDAEHCYVCCVLNTSTSELVQKAFDNDDGTFHSYFSKDRVIVGLDLGPGRESVISSIRFYPRPGYEASMVGGRFQGSNLNEGAGYEDLHVIEDAPPASEYSIARISNPKAFRWLRYLGPSESFGDVSEIEFHRGFMVEELSNKQSGNISWNVDVQRLQREENVEIAMLIKCAAHGLLPAFLSSNTQEVVLPNSQGIVITTGNLGDINKETGSFSSINVAEHAIVHGSIKLGDPEKDTMLEVNAAVYGLSFRGPLIDSDSIMSVQQTPTSVDTTISLPDYSGTLVVGELPAVMNRMDVLPSAGIDFDWSVRFDDAVNFGERSQGTSSSLDILAVLGDSFPLSFGGTFPSGRKVSIGSPQASKDSVVTLPDATGTILTTGSIPKVVGNISAIDHTVLQGGATFKDYDVEIGEQGLDIGLNLNANIMGFTSLTFDGTSRKDGRTLVLSAADPEAHNDITLPDTSGTIITTANFPSLFDSLRAVGTLEVMGDAIAEVPSIRVGGSGRISHIAFKAHVTGKFPLVFDGGTVSDGETTAGQTTTLQVPETSRHNILTFPDISGTVVTSTTLPSRTVTVGTYTVDATQLLVSSQQTSMGLSTKLSGNYGSFHFADSFARDRKNRPERDNQFMVHALGGVNFITGQTMRGKQTGAFLRAGSSAWYYVSDREAKSAFQEVNASAVVTDLGRVPVYLWRYSGNHSGALHIGPMAQDMYSAFSVGEHSDRISASDADGVAMAAIQGLHEQIVQLNSTASQYKKHLALQQTTIMEQRAQLARQAQLLDHLSHRIRRLWTSVSSQLIVADLTLATSTA